MTTTIAWSQATEGVEFNCMEAMQGSEGTHYVLGHLQDIL